jgi:hypothetical protein
MIPGVNHVSSFPKSAPIKQSDTKAAIKSKSLPSNKNNEQFNIKCPWAEGNFVTPFNCNVNGEPWGTPSEK